MTLDGEHWRGGQEEMERKTKQNWRELLLCMYVHTRAPFANEWVHFVVGRASTLDAPNRAGLVLF